MVTPGPDRRAPFAATVALATLAAVAGFAVVMPLVMTAIPPHVLRPPFPPQNQRAETLVYLLAYAALLPLGLLAGRWAADAVAARVGGAAATALAGALAAGFALALVAVRGGARLGIDDGVLAVLAVAVAWWVVAVAVIALVLREPSWPPLRRLTPGAAWTAAAAAGLVALLCFARIGSIDPFVVGACAVGTAVATAALGRSRLPRPRAPWGPVLDALAVAAVLILVPDLVIFRPEEAAGDAAIAIETGIIQFHHNFLLGPANEVLHGRAMLAGAASQYGVTSLYLLAAWFQVAPIGYGTFGLLAGALTALWFASGYAVLRLAGTGRLLAAGALGVAVVALAYNLLYPVGALPQSGPLRFGLPMAVLLAAVAGERFPARARIARWAELAAVGLAAVWSLEAIAYSLVVYAAVAGARAWLDPAGGVGRRLARAALAAVVACGAAHVVFALATLVAAGTLPDWGEYLAYVRAFLFGEVGDLTYDVARWTPALPVGAGLLASAAALAELARRRAPVLDRERPALVALAGMTVYAIALLSYYVDRSQDHILVHVALPALLTATLWVALALRTDTLPRTALACGLGVAALVLAVAWSAIPERLPRTPLAHAAPGGRSLDAALDRLWHPPPLDPRAPAGEHALAAHVPGERESLVMTPPDLGLEILLRSGRGDRLRLGDPREASFIAEDALPALEEELRGLRAGDRMLLDEPTLALMPDLRERDVLADPRPELAELQQWALQRILARFELRRVAPAAGGFTMMELVARR